LLIPGNIQRRRRAGGLYTRVGVAHLFAVKMSNYTLNDKVATVGGCANRLGGLVSHAPSFGCVCTPERNLSENGSGRLIAFEVRPSDSPFVERIWRSRSDYAGVFHSIAACSWDVVVSRVKGRTTVTVRGPETKVTMADCPAEGEWFGVRFKLGTYMPLMRCGDLRDRNDVNLPNATSRSFWLNGSAWEFPNFENAETFVQRLVQAGLLVADRTVERAIRGEVQQVSMRTEQRRVLQVTGLTYGAIHQIERARRATIQLQRGVPVLDVVDEAGYYDQSHLTRSLRRFIGLTPARIARDEQQLSLLYNQ
jgi:hypothetical protein